MRTYEPAWIKLKTAGRVRITENPRLHKRIIKAITKEKWLDEGFKYECLNPTKPGVLPHKMELLYRREGSIIIFWLEKYKKYENVRHVELGDI